MIVSDKATSGERPIAFGPFELRPRERVLLEDGKPIHLGSRAIDLLMALLERPGDLVSKDELISRVWPGVHVVEGNLKFQIASLRRALRDGRAGRRYLATCPGQGYRFVAEITSVDADPAPPSAPSSSPGSKHNLPARLTSLVGRDDLVAKLQGRVAAKRLITIIGPGGIGKTSVAMATAERLIDDYEGGVWCVDFARLSDPALVPRAVADAIHINLNPEDPLASLAAALSDQRMLLVLDNCAHVVDAVASSVFAIMSTARRVHILATSREPLQVEGEHVVRLEPLEAPLVSEGLDAAEALQFPAVQLFVDRMAASHDDFELHDQDAPLVAEICRKLDGIPLAIELAAARVDLGLRELSARLDEGLQILKAGRRTALPRHQTMRATLDWSYGLLSPAAQTVLRRLGIFAGGFTLAAAAALVCDADLGDDEAVDIVMELVTKSLVSVDGSLDEPRFRLLGATHAYALERAGERDELGSVAKSHASYFLALFESASRADAEFDRASAALAFEIDNLRAALEKAFAPPGDPAVGIKLTAASVPLWVSLSRLGEWDLWAERAILALGPTNLLGTRQEMIIRATQGMSLQLRNRASEAHAALTRALELAVTLGDPDYQLRILHSLWTYHMRLGEVRTAIAFARRAEPIADSLGSPVASVTLHSMISISLNWEGEHSAARRRIDLLLQEATPAARRQLVHRTGHDLYIVARDYLARILWVQGYPDRAMNSIVECIEETRRLQSPYSLCAVLAIGGCPLALQTGDLDMAERWATELVGIARRYALEYFRASGQAVQEIVALRREHGNRHSEQYRLAIQPWRAAGWYILLSNSDFVVALAGAGDAAEISALVGAELERAEREQALSMTPELLRIRGELLLQGSPDPELAEDSFRRSMERAHSQGALSWELRAAMSLASLQQATGRTIEARRLLQSRYDRFTEGFGSYDLRRAKRLLDG